MADIAPCHILWKYIQENVVCFGIGNGESQPHVLEFLCYVAQL